VSDYHLIALIFEKNKNRDPDMISITSAPAAPPPRIRILDPTGGDVETVRIGDRLIFRIEIPGNSMKQNSFICLK
jgi:hypothetical protein